MSKGFDVTIEPLGYKYISCALPSKSDDRYEMLLEHRKKAVARKLQESVIIDDLTVVWPVEHEIHVFPRADTETLTSRMQWGKIIDIKDFNAK